jgi:hypothetical protein
VKKAASQGKLTADLAHRLSHDRSGLFHEYCDVGGNFGEVILKETVRHHQMTRSSKGFKHFTFDQMVAWLNPMGVVAGDPSSLERHARATKSALGVIEAFKNGPGGIEGAVDREDVIRHVSNPDDENLMMFNMFIGKEQTDSSENSKISSLSIQTSVDPKAVVVLTGANGMFGSNQPLRHGAVPKLPGGNASGAGDLMEKLAAAHHKAHQRSGRKKADAPDDKSEGYAPAPKKPRKANTKASEASKKGSKAVTVLPEEPIERAKCTAKQLCEDVTAGNTLVMELGSDRLMQGCVEELKTNILIYQRQYDQLKELIKDGKSNDLDYRDCYKAIEDVRGSFDATMDFGRGHIERQERADKKARSAKGKEKT